MTSPLKILMLCTKFPYPPKDGGTMAMHSMIRGFSKAGHQVTVLTMNTSKHFVVLRSMPLEIQRMANFYAVDVDTQVRFIDALANLIFSKESYHVVRFTSKAFQAQLERLLEKNDYDVIQLETLFMAPYIPTIRRMKPKSLISLRAHNIEHEIWSRRADNENNPIKEYYFRETAARIKTFEETTYATNPFDVAVPITGRDAGIVKNMGVKTPVWVSPAGIDEDDLDTSEVKTEPQSLFYIGSLDWGPNVEGLEWFLKNVWPKIVKMHPKVKFYLAGRSMPDKYLKLEQENIVIAGEVESAGKFIRSKSIMVVPILSGSGMRVKIAEGLAYGKPIVATRIAAEGIGVKHGYDILLADTPEEFANCLSILIEKQSMVNTIGQHAKGLWMRELKNDKIINGLVDFYRKEVAKKGK
ncbi:MAG: glycosyltransferase family 4 protein [Bacteroidia bacterium]|nr:glycosyltransferase family 4 protein [Bacteroidia bacterium]